MLSGLLALALFATVLPADLPRRPVLPMRPVRGPILTRAHLPPAPERKFPEQPGLTMRAVLGEDESEGRACSSKRNAEATPRATHGIDESPAQVRRHSAAVTPGPERAPLIYPFCILLIWNEL